MMMDEGECSYSTPLLTLMPWERSMVGATKAKDIEEPCFRNDVVWMEK